jgi:uncharacterized protein (TIGR03083 family)
MNSGDAPQGLDYLGHLASSSARFVDVLAQAPAGARVPTCPDWDADDLLWHLGQVQWFWAAIVGRGLTAEADVEALARPPRPGSRVELCRHFYHASGDLQRNLRDTSPDTPAWTWSHEQTVGFILRRQAHEALIHRLDAELTTGDRTRMDAELSTDGVDEALEFMGSGIAPRGPFPPERANTVQVRTSDTDRAWLVTLGLPSGTHDGRAGDEPHVPFVVSPGVTSDAGQCAAATMSGTAADLDCLLWHRPTTGKIERAGDPLVLGRLEEILAGDHM